jgi:hypothetical protein
MYLVLRYWTLFNSGNFLHQSLISQSIDLYETSTETSNTNRTSRVWMPWHVRNILWLNYFDSLVHIYRYMNDNFLLYDNAFWQWLGEYKPFVIVFFLTESMVSFIQRPEVNLIFVWIPNFNGLLFIYMLAMVYVHWVSYAVKQNSWLMLLILQRILECFWIQ